MKSYSRANCKVVWRDNYVKIVVDPSDEGSAIRQDVYLSRQEAYLLYMALGDALKEKLTPRSTHAG